MKHEAAPHRHQKKKEKKKCSLAEVVSAGERSGGFSRLQCRLRLGYLQVGRGWQTPVGDRIIGWCQVTAPASGGVVGYQQALPGVSIAAAAAAQTRNPCLQLYFGSEPRQRPALFSAWFLFIIVPPPF